MNSQTYDGFKSLDCYKQARELRMYISQLTKKFPKEEKYNLTSQILDASRSITANIAEGYGRYTYKDTRNFFIQARGSDTEVMEHLQTALDEKFITAEEFAEGDRLCVLVFKLINGYIAYLDRTNKK
jgi:four helix bundle protein